MIRVSEKDNFKIVSAHVTDFTDAMGYCQHKIPFMMKGQKIKQSPATIQGSVVHKEIEEYEDEYVELEPISEVQLEDEKHDFEFAREKIFTRLLHPMKIEQENVVLFLMGRADKIMRNGSTLIVQDEKTAYNVKKYDALKEPYNDQKLQVLSYLNSQFTDQGSMDPKDWFDVPHTQKMWRLNILDPNNGYSVYKSFEQYQDDIALSFLHENFRVFTTVVLGHQEAEHHNLKNKCKPCGYFDDCTVRLE